MIRILITTFILCFLPAILLAQVSYVSTSHVLYQYDQDLKRIEISSSEVETTLTIDVVNKKAILKSTDLSQAFTILTIEEFQLESGVIYKYDITGNDGELRKLEINTQKRTFIIKPKEIKAGETTRKYSYN